jgi:hemolysin activation/secretion protein
MGDAIFRGSRGARKYQSSSTFFVDNPLKLNDLLYLSVQHDLGGGEPESTGPRGSRGAVLHYKKTGSNYHFLTFDY